MADENIEERAEDSIIEKSPREKLREAVQVMRVKLDYLATYRCHIIPYLLNK